MDALEDLLRAALHEMGRGRHAEAAALLAPHAHVASNPLQRYLGESLRRSGQAQAAIGPLMQALALKIDDIDAYLQLAFALQTLQMKTEAAECFRRAAELKPYNKGYQEQAKLYSPFLPDPAAAATRTTATPR